VQGDLNVAKARKADGWDKDQLYREYLKLGTLRAVGRQYGVTRERIRQILKGYDTTLGYQHASERRKARHPLNEKRVEIERLLAEGLNVSEIARRLRINYSQLLNYCHSRNIGTPNLSEAISGRPNRKNRKFDWSKAKRLWKNGKNRAEIARELGVTHKAVADAFVYEGILPKPSYWEPRRQVRHPSGQTGDPNA